MTSTPPQASTRNNRGSSSGGLKTVYHKFTGNMDNVLLEIMQETNPYLAKHGMVMSVWIEVAKKLGRSLYDDDEAFAWHQCRDRIAALLRGYEEGDLSRICKKLDSEQVNSRKEQLLEILSNIRSVPKGKRATVDFPGLVLESNSDSLLVDGSNTAPSATKKRRRGSGGSSLNVSSSVASSSFRLRILELVENKIRADAEYRRKDFEMREKEVELQSQFLELLKNKASGTEI